MLNSINKDDLIRDVPPQIRRRLQKLAVDTHHAGSTLHRMASMWGRLMQRQLHVYQCSIRPALSLRVQKEDQFAKVLFDDERALNFVLPAVMKSTE